MNFRENIGIAALSLLTVLAGGHAIGASFTVSPVELSLTPTSPIGAITVQNSGTETTIVQLSIVSWNQIDGKDIYAPTTDLLATPPIFMVEGGKSQIVRVGLRRAMDATSELSYRIYFQEVPLPREAPSTGLRVALRMGVPVFVRPRSCSLAPAVHWRIVQSSPDVFSVSAKNSGNTHVKILSLSLFLPEGEPLVSQYVFSTVLPGESRKWSIQMKRPVCVKSLRLVATTGAGDIDADLIPVQTR
jgi:fimbrial chaperone protein